MKLIVILTVVAFGLGFSVWKTLDWFTEKKRRAEMEQLQQKYFKEEKARQEEEEKSGAVPDPVPGPVSSVAVPASSPVLGVEQVGSYRFLNRLAPPAPSIFSQEGKTSLLVQTDDSSNSWVWVGPPLLTSQILDMAKAFDVRQVELDLDFVLVLLSTEELRTRGISVFYQESASWLNVLSLTGDAGSLRISSQGWAVELGLGASDVGVQLLSQPVIRCLDGQKWEFSNDSEVPIPRSEIVDGVIRNSVEYRPVGFGLTGVVRVVGDSILLSVEQRNGSVAPATIPAASVDVPTLTNQVLNTSVALGWSEWSVLGGIQVDREEMKRGLFRDSVRATSDYLVIFVRPRLALDAPPRAVPVDGAATMDHPLLDDFGVLPAKGAVK